MNSKIMHQNKSMQSRWNLDHIVHRTNLHVSSQNPEIMEATRAAVKRNQNESFGVKEHLHKNMFFNAYEYFQCRFD